MTDKQRMDLQVIAENILSIKNKLESAKHYLDEYKKKYDEFVEVFQENKGAYLVQGIICIAVLIFDFWVSEKSLLYLAQILRIKVEFIAILFSLLDGGIAILASGGLAGTNLNIRKNMQRTWRPVLVVLAVVKIILFSILIYTSYYMVDVDGRVIFQLGTWDMIKILVPQIFFVAVVYFVLGKAGFGLWYVVGRMYFGLWKFLLSDPDQLEAKLKEQCNDFKATVENFKLDVFQIAKKYNIENLFNSNI